MTETIEIEKLVRYNATDGDILVLTPNRALGREEANSLHIQMEILTGRIKQNYGKDVLTVVLPHGFKLELISVGSQPEKPKEYFTIEEYKIWKGIDPDKPVWYGSYWCFDKWSDAQDVLEFLEKNSGGKALLRIAPSHVAKESPPTTGLGIGEYLLREFYSGSASIRRACWPTGDHISTDSAEGGTLWYYSADEDELTKDYKLDFHDLAASDWEIIDEGTILR